MMEVAERVKTEASVPDVYANEIETATDAIAKMNADEIPATNTSENTAKNGNDTSQVSHEMVEGERDDSGRLQSLSGHDGTLEEDHQDVPSDRVTSPVVNPPIPLCIVAAICAVDQIEIPSSVPNTSLPSTSPTGASSAILQQFMLKTIESANQVLQLPAEHHQSLVEVSSTSNGSINGGVDVKVLPADVVNPSVAAESLDLQQQSQQQLREHEHDGIVVSRNSIINTASSVSVPNVDVPNLILHHQVQVTESPGGESNNGPGYYVDTTVSSSSDGVDGNGESILSTPTEVIQHPPQPHDQQQQLTAITYQQQAAAAQQAAQLAANAAALQAAQAQEAMAAAAASQAQTDPTYGTIPQSMSAMSLHPQQTAATSMPMSGMANGVISSVTYTSMANSGYSDGTMGVPMMMQQQVSMDPRLMHQQHPQDGGQKGNKNMFPTPPASADEKDHDDPEKKKHMNMEVPPNVTASSGPGPVPVSLMHFNGQNGPMQGAIPGPSGPPSGPQGVHQYNGPPGGHMMGGGIERMPVPMPPEAHAMYNPMPGPHDIHEHEEEELSPTGAAVGVIRPRANSNKRRNNKKPVPVEDKDDKYFERRKRNNLAAKRSRDARKHREDTIVMRANFLERENVILRAQLATLREEANSLRQLLSQRTMTTMTVGPNGQQINTHLQ